METGKGKYLRPLRDYQILLTDYRLRRSTLVRQIQNAEADRAYVQTALALAEKQREYREREKARLTAEKEEAEYELAAVGELLKKLQGEVEAYRTQLSQLVAQNLRAAAELDRIQQEAKQRIDARTGRMVQSTTAGAR